MNAVYLVGTGATPVGEHFSSGLVDLALEALREALNGIDPRRLGALYIGNALGGELNGQSQLGALLASVAGVPGVEAVRVEAGGASGACALRQAFLAVAGGVYDLVAVVGVEKTTDRLDAQIEAAQAQASDAETEAIHGITITSQWAMLMRRYMHVYGYQADAFAPFPVNAHANGVHNTMALYRFAINTDKYRKAPMIASPLNMLDCATAADGAAAVLVAGAGLARELAGPRIRIAGSALATDRVALHQRRDPLRLEAAGESARRALYQARLHADEIGVFELSDPHGIAAVLGLEAIGLAEPGQGVQLGLDGAITPRGRTPLATGGGYKARGDVGGANGIYQVVDLVRQLRGAAGSTQVGGAHTGLSQCLGGTGATAVTHILTIE